MNTFYLVNYLFVLVLAVLLGRNGSNRSRITFIVLVSLFIMLEASLRSIDVGSDTPNYVHYFEETFETPWEDLLNQFIMRYFTDENEQDIGFFILAKTVSTFTESFQVYTFILLCIFFIPLGIFLYKYTSDFLQLTLAYVFFISLFLIFPMTGARQIQAMGPGILAVSYIGDRKLWKSLLCVLFGLMLHSSLLLIVPYILLCYFKPSLGKLFHLLSFLFVPIVLMFTNQIILLMADASGMEKYKVYGEDEIQGGAFVFIILLVLMSFFCYISLKKDYLEEHERIQRLYLVLPFMTLFGPLIHSNGSMIRISMYFHMYLMVLIPYSLDVLFPPEKRKLMYFLTMFALILFSLYGAYLEYDFYWNDPPGTWL